MANIPRGKSLDEITSDRSTGALVEGYPAGLKPLFFTELWERFSYYGMRALLVLYMVAPQVSGGLGMPPADAALIYGNYTMAVYMLSIPGGFLADRVIGAARAVLIGGVVIACGHFALAIPARECFYLGLGLIVLGTGLFKPNISALLGSLYREGDERRDAGFSIFYMGINIGGFAAPLVTGFLAQSEMFRRWLAAAGIDPAMSWHFGFAAAGVGMSLGLAHFVLRAPSFSVAAASPATADGAGRWGILVVLGTAALLGLTLASDRPGWEFLRYGFLLIPATAAVWLAFSGDVVRRRLAAVMIFFVAAMIFFALFEQTGVTIALFAENLTRSEIAGFSFPSSWFQSLNALFVILLAPIFARVWLRLGARQPTSPVKFALGLAFLAASFLIMVPAANLTAEGRVSPAWLVAMFFLLTVGELFLSPVGLSTMTKLAPVHLVGLVLGLWFLGAAWGNKLAGVFGAEYSATGADGLAHYFLWQSALVLGAALVMLALTPWLKRLMGGVH